MNLRILCFASAVCLIGFGPMGCGDADQAKRPPEVPPAIAGVPSRLPSEPDEVLARSREKSASRPAPKREPELKRFPPIEYYSTDAPLDPNGRFFLIWKEPMGEVAAFGLTGIHDHVVRTFTLQPGMGESRALLMPLMTELTELVTVSGGEKSNSTLEEGRRPQYDARIETLILPDGAKRIVREAEWKVRALQLVSVDAEGGPGVYLPQPDVVHNNKSKKIATGENTPKRKLDEFETEALARLRKGDDLAVQGSSEAIRMLGAIRSKHQCSMCHKVPNGTLLGAFTYELRPKTEEKAVEMQPPAGVGTPADRK